VEVVLDTKKLKKTSSLKMITRKYLSKHKNNNPNKQLPTSIAILIQGKIIQA